MLRCIQLVSDRRVDLGCIREVLIVVCGNRKVQRVVGSVFRHILVVCCGENIACLIRRADARVDIHTVEKVSQHSEREVSLNVCVLADGAAVALRNRSDCVGVCVVTEGRNTLLLGPSVEHGHAHAVVVRCDNVNLIAEGGSPGADAVSCRCSVPSCARCVLHLLRSQLSHLVGLAVHFDLAVLDNRCHAVDVRACRRGIDCAVLLNRRAECLSDTSRTSDRVVVADVPNGKDVTDRAVAVLVDLGSVLLDVLDNHLTLELGTLVCVEAYIVGLVVEVKCLFVELARGAVGGLTVVPNQGLILVCNHAGLAARNRGLACALAAACRRRAALGLAAAAASCQHRGRHRHSCDDANCLLHN